MNIKESENLGLYLGLPLSHKRPKRSEVQFVVDKVRRKLAMWIVNLLLGGGLVNFDQIFHELNCVLLHARLPTLESNT